MGASRHRPGTVVALLPAWSGLAAAARRRSPRGEGPPPPAPGRALAGTAGPHVRAWTAGSGPRTAADRHHRLTLRPGPPCTRSGPRNRPAHSRPSASRAR
ncbi:PTPA-CTERM sorting domain-containing protein [Kitasatospora xanthocidica]|uniref:PTPA-CTERM sorting domain-containing protein n=1 Tax=Kitasatospora xanthocidica TaxID=83382 RepID=UPI001C702945